MRLDIRTGAGVVQRLSLPSLYERITGARAKVKPGRIVLLLTKDLQVSWPKLKSTDK